MPSQVQVVLQNLAGVCNGEALGRREAARAALRSRLRTTAVLGARGLPAKRAEWYGTTRLVSAPGGPIYTAHLAIVIVC
jgi:hypothetical protein